LAELGNRSPGDSRRAVSEMEKELQELKESNEHLELVNK
jgi:hypothetical protein